MTSSMKWLVLGGLTSVFLAAAALQVMTACIDDASTMENACRVLKYLCTSMQVRIAALSMTLVQTERLRWPLTVDAHAPPQLHAGPMLPMLAAKLVQCFQHRPHSCFLYCSATLVSVFGASPDESHQVRRRHVVPELKVSTPAHAKHPGWYVDLWCPEDQPRRSRVVTPSGITAVCPAQTNCAVLGH